MYSRLTDTLSSLGFVLLISKEYCQQIYNFPATQYLDNFINKTFHQLKSNGLLLRPALKQKMIKGLGIPATGEKPGFVCTQKFRKLRKFFKTGKAVFPLNPRKLRKTVITDHVGSLEQVKEDE